MKLRHKNFAPHILRFTFRGSRSPSSLIHHPLSSRSGIALVIVMIAILVLAVLAGGFAWSMKVETTLARNANSEAELEWLGRSGVEYARWVLAYMDPTKPYDSLDQAWATGQGFIGPTNATAVEVQNPVHLGNGTFTWKIVDLERKFNINIAGDPRNEAIARQILERALIVMGADASESPPVISAIMDWIDPGDDTHLEGAESDYYQGLPTPYVAKNGPIDDISELLLIRGISQDMYWGSSSTNHPPGTFQQRQNRFGGSLVPVSYSVGLVDLFTPLSDGKININTASSEVFQLLGLDAMVAQAIVDGRGGEDDGSGLLGPYKNLAELPIKVPVLPRALPPQIQQFCDVRSKTFEVQVEAQIANYKREFRATLGRNSPRDVQVLNFYWK
jgi:type II secretory pathway component PulK